MGEYLGRYFLGEPHQVWSEIEGMALSQLSLDVQTDIQSVCNETMRRVRGNAETLIEALDSIGFKLTRTLLLGS